MISKSWITKTVKKWVSEDRSLSGWITWEADRIRETNGNVSPAELAPRIKELCREWSSRAPRALSSDLVPLADYAEVARGYLAQNQPVEVAGTCPTRETYLAAAALASDPNIRELALEGDLETAMDRVRARILEDMPDLPEGVYRDLLVNALEGVSYAHLVMGLRRSE
jgi:hypothetical protein